MDQVDQSSSDDLGINGNVTPDQQDSANQMANDQVAGINCRSAPRGSKCPKGSSQVTETSGLPGQLAATMARLLANASGMAFEEQDYPGSAAAQLARLRSPPTTKIMASRAISPATELAKEAKDAAKAPAESAVEQVALNVAAKIFCRVAVPALLAMLELLEDVIPIPGEVTDTAEIAATPAIIQGCVKGIERECKAEFQVFGKKFPLDRQAVRETYRNAASSDKP